MISNKRQKLVEDYENITILGKGTYGTVYKVKDKIDGQIYAIKKMAKLERTEGLSLTSIREITLLQQCKHENIIQLKQVVRSKSDNEIYLVMEFCESDLDTIYDKALGQPQKKRKIENKQNQQVQVLTDKQIKNIMRQLIKGVKYLHDNCIVHRDLKLSNLLFNQDGFLKIADFGLARRIGNQPPHQYTPRVVTLWYRSPELLLSNWKDLNYIKSIDIWSIGCILGQLLQNGNPIMPGSSELEEMELICDLLGMPESDTQIYECLMQQNSNLFQKGYQNKIDERFRNCDPNALDLMKQMLKWEPKERISLEKAMLHAYFEESQENIKN